MDNSHHVEGNLCVVCHSTPATESSQETAQGRPTYGNTGL